MSLPILKYHFEKCLTNETKAPNTLELPLAQIGLILSFILVIYQIVFQSLILGSYLSICTH